MVESGGASQDGLTGMQFDSGLARSEPSGSALPAPDLTPEVQQPEGYIFSWHGRRVPAHLTIDDPRDPTGEQKIVDQDVSYMQAGLIMLRNGRVGLYKRRVDFELQPDGTHLNEIEFFPISPEDFIRGLYERRNRKQIE